MALGGIPVGRQNQYTGLCKVEVLPTRSVFCALAHLSATWCLCAATSFGQSREWAHGVLGFCFFWASFDTLDVSDRKIRIQGHLCPVAMRIKCNLLLVLAITCSYCVVFLLFVRLSPKNEPLKITRIGSLGVHKKQNSDHEPRIILLWTTWFDDLRWLKVDDYHEQLKSCPKQNCIFSRDR